MLGAEDSSWLIQTGGTVEAGYVVALAFICLVQYGLHIYYLLSTRRQTNHYESEIKQLNTERENQEKTRLSTNLENQILRDFVSTNDAQKAADVLLRYFAPNTARQFAAIFRWDKSKFTIERSRGLSKDSLQNWMDTIKDFQPPAEQDVQILRDRTLRQSTLWVELTPEDRKKANELFLFSLGSGSGLLTTSLCLPQESREDQLALAMRLMGSIGHNVKLRLAQQQREQEIRMTEELLQLRSLTDRTYNSPFEMVQTYVSALQSMLDADGAVLFLPAIDTDSPWKAMVRCEVGLSLHLLSQWENHEMRLVEECDHSLEFQVFNGGELRKLGIESLMRSAMLVPLIQRKQVAGVFCFSRRADVPFRLPHHQLAVWASQHLGKTLVKLQSIAEIKRQAQQDGLTKLANRRTFDEQLDREIRVAHRAAVDCSLLLCDLDRFKSVNDTYGHQAGDEVLKIVAKIIHEEAQKTPAGERSLAARYGGEEIAVILPGQSQDVAAKVGERIRRSVANAAIWWQQMPIRVTISIGAATFSRHAKSSAELIAAADAALYQAKAMGRDRVCFPAEHTVGAKLH